MRVTDHYVSLVKIRKQLKDFTIVHIPVNRGTAVLDSPSKRNMDAEKHHLVLLVFHEIQVFFQPFELSISDSAVISPTFAVSFDRHNVIHHDEMHVSPVERIIRRTEFFHVTAYR